MDSPFLVALREALGDDHVLVRGDLERLRTDGTRRSGDRDANGHAGYAVASSTRVR